MTPAKSRKSQNSSTATGSPSLVLTPRQVQILKLIHRYRSSNGCSPTLQELAEILQLSKVTVFEHVQALVQKHILHHTPNKARSLMIDRRVNLSEYFCVDQDEGEQEGTDRLSSAGAAFPLIGQVAAGLPVDAAEVPELLDVGLLFESSSDTFALKVRGDSMIDEQIRDGDYVLVRQSDSAHNGQIVVACLESGETTLKKFYRDKKGLRLEAANPDYPTIRASQVAIQGIVIGIIRRLKD